MTKRNPDIFDTLKAEHDEVADLMKAIAASDDDKPGRVKRKKVFDKLYTALSAHAKGEEAALYPVLEEIEATRDIALEAGEEHKVVETLLDELKAMRSADDQWMAKFTVLQENVEHHVKEEEGEMFRKAKAELSEAQLDRIEAKYAEVRDQQLEALAK
jgi:hemerythrin superfamily protein